FAQEADLAPCGGQHAGDEVEGGAFAGAVGADQAHDFAGLEREADVVHGNQAAELLAYRVDLKHQRAFGGPGPLHEVGGLGRRCDAPAFGLAGQGQPPRGQDGPDAVARVLQHQYHQDAEDDELEVGAGVEDFGQDVLQLVLQGQDQPRTQHGAPHAARAAHHRHEQIFDAVVQAEGAGTDGALHVCVKPSRNAGQQGRVHKDDDFVAGHVDAEGFGHAASAFQGAYGAAGAGIQQVARCQHGQQDEDPDQVIDMATLAQRETEEFDGRDAGDAVILAQEFKIAEQVIQRQAPGYGAQLQVMAGQPQRDGAQHIGDQEGQHEADQQRHPWRPAHGRGQPGGGVGPYADERGLP